MHGLIRLVLKPGYDQKNFREQKEIKTISKTTSIRMPSAPTQSNAESTRLLG
jgi:hypothetical protein